MEVADWTSGPGYSRSRPLPLSKAIDRPQGHEAASPHVCILFPWPPDFKFKLSSLQVQQESAGGCWEQKTLSFLCGGPPAPELLSPFNRFLGERVICCWFGLGVQQEVPAGLEGQYEATQRRCWRRMRVSAGRRAQRRCQLPPGLLPAADAPRARALNPGREARFQ